MYESGGRGRPSLSIVSLRRGIDENAMWGTDSSSCIRDNAVRSEGRSTIFVSDKILDVQSNDVGGGYGRSCDSLHFKLIRSDDVGQAKHSLVHRYHFGGHIQASADVAHYSYTQ